MELKEYITIFRNNLNVFFLTVAIVVLGAVIFQLFRPLSYQSSLTLNITRLGTQNTSAYRYDDFYRLQADERFADTVVRWLGSPKTVVDIYNDAGITTSELSERALSGAFKSQRLSSQMISVRYVTTDINTAQKTAASITKILNQETEQLNQYQKEETWFKILENDPVIRKNAFPWQLIIFGALALGIFLGIWSVLIKHYWSE